jgi:hypothetical protein
MLCIFLEDPSHCIAGNPIYENHEIPIVVIGVFLPPESIPASFIEKARPDIDLLAGEEE